MTKSEFKKLNVLKRWNAIKEKGVHFGSREFNGYWVYLYGLSDFYVEVWIMIALEQIRWVEIQENQNQIDLYLKDIDLNDLK